MFDGPRLGVALGDGDAVLRPEPPAAAGVRSTGTSSARSSRAPGAPALGVGVAGEAPGSEAARRSPVRVGSALSRRISSGSAVSARYVARPITTPMSRTDTRQANRPRLVRRRTIRWGRRA